MRESAAGFSIESERASSEAQHPSSTLGKRSNQTGRRIVCYNPYGSWRFHALYEMTILRALQHRGADVHYVACDGLFEMCDMFNASKPKPPNGCSACMAGTAQHLLDMNMQYVWLGRFVGRGVPERAREWALGIPTSELLQARYDDAPLGEWIAGSVFSYFRLARLDWSDFEVTSVFRQHLASAVVAYEGLNAMLTDLRPDVLFLFNGRLSSTRIAFELARRRDIRVICHERGVVLDSLQLWENEHCLGNRCYRDGWSAWSDVALTAEQVKGVSRWLDDRRRGKRLNWLASNPRLQSVSSLYETLGLDPKRPIVALLTSSDDELAADPNWGQIFPNQTEWVERAVSYIAGRPDLQMVIRVHPNSGAKNMNMSCGQFLDDIRRIASALPDNVWLVMPDENTGTYALIDAAQAGLVYITTAGLEMAALGKPVLVSGRCPYYGLPFVDSLNNAGDFERAVEGLLRQRPSPERKRLAYRFIHHVLLGLSIPMRLVDQHHVYSTRLNYHPSDSTVFDVGRDPEMDRIVRIFLTDESVIKSPQHEDRMRSQAGEDKFFGGSASLLSNAPR